MTDPRTVMAEEWLANRFGAYESHDDWDLVIDTEIFLAGMNAEAERILAMLRSEQCAQHSDLACSDDYADWLESQLAKEEA